MRKNEKFIDPRPLKLKSKVWDRKKILVSVVTIHGSHYLGLEKTLDLIDWYVKIGSP